VRRQPCTRAVQGASFRTAGRPLEIAVNRSLTELRDTNLVDDVAAILRQTGLDPTSLILEVTESTAMRDPHATIATMRRLRALRVRLALDDFGTGYSSLSHLEDLPVDRLKIPKPLVVRLLGEPPRSALVESVVRLASPLHLDSRA